MSSMEMKRVRKSIVPQPKPRQSGRPVTVYRLMQDGKVVKTRTRQAYVSLNPVPEDPDLEPRVTVIVSSARGWDFVDDLHEIGDRIQFNELEAPADYDAIYGPDAEAA